MQNHEGFRLRYDLRMNAEEETADIMIYGELCSGMMKWTPDDVSAADFDRMLREAKCKGAKKLNVHINSPGGDVNQAVAMRAMLMSSGMEETTISIEGLCASAATLIACVPGARVRMVRGGEYMIHNPRCRLYGEAKDMESAARRLRNTESESAAIYAGRSGMREEDIRAMMDAETWMTADEAMQKGFVDEVTDGAAEDAAVSAITMSAMRRMYAHVPDSVRVRTEQNDSNADPAVASGTAAEHMKEDEKTMDIGTITLEQLRDGNPALYGQIMQAGAQQERERQAEIDDLTPAGEAYARMAAQAKADGTSAMDYHKAIVKRSREQGQTYLSQREQETKSGLMVTGGSAKDNDAQGKEKEIDSIAREVAEIAKSLYSSADGMY